MQLSKSTKFVHDRLQLIEIHKNGNIFHYSYHTVNFPASSKESGNIYPGSFLNAKTTQCSKGCKENRIALIQNGRINWKIVH